MQFETFNQKMYEAGDAYVHYISPVSKKHKYHICTLEINDCKYIQDKLASRSAMAEPKEGFVRTFCWDLDDFKNIDVSSVTSVVPLSTALKWTTSAD